MRLRLRPAALLAVPALIAAGDAGARSDGRTPSLVSIAIPAQGSATVATVVVTPRPTGGRPDVGVVEPNRLPAGLVAALRMALRQDGSFLVTVALINRGRKGISPPFRLAFDNVRQARWTVASQVEDWPRAPLGMCRSLDAVASRDSVSVFRRLGGTEVTLDQLFAVARKLVCDRPASPVLLGRLGLPTGTWTVTPTGRARARATGSFSVGVTSFFLARLPRVVRATCPARFECSPGQRLPPGEPIVAYEGRARAGARLETELTFAARTRPRAAWLSFVSGGDQIGPISVRVRR